MDRHFIPRTQHKHVLATATNLALNWHVQKSGQNKAFVHRSDLNATVGAVKPVV